MKDLSAMVTSYKEISEFWINWQQVLSGEEEIRSPFKDIQVVITYVNGGEQPTVSIFREGGIWEVYPCLLETRESKNQIPTFFSEVADYLKIERDFRKN